MKTVLVTALGTAAAAAVVKELKKAGGFHIIGADINLKNQIASSLDVDEFYQFPYAASSGYIPFVLDFCKEHKVEYYYAIIDKEVVNISEKREEFEKVGTKLCVVNYEFARICHYKQLFFQWINEHVPEVAVKTYDSLEEAEKATYPLFIKPAEGMASTGCRKIGDFNELKTFVTPEQAGKEILIQEYVSGQNITVDCIRNKKTGQTFQLQRRELLRNSNGCGIAVELFYDKKLEDICNELMEKLDLNGVVNMEFFDTGNGYKIIEINPRLSAGSMYSCLAGISTVMNALYIADEEPCIFAEVPVGAHFAERYEVYRMD